MSAHTELRSIPGYSGYSASPMGAIYSHIPWRGQAFRELVSIQNGNGYVKVRLETPNGRRNIPVHKLMALAFLGPRPDVGYEVRHKDGNRFNNAWENLEWGTRQENADDREAHGRTSRGERHSQAIKRGKANARLIAAAPELLRELRIACAALEVLGADVSSFKAISKVEGTK